MAAQNVASGATLTVYAISRDASDNFVANVAADTWSLPTKTGGVLDGNLVAAVDLKSAVFTGGLVGTAVIRAVKAGLTSTDSGTITVVAGAADHLVYTTPPTGASGGVLTPASIVVEIRDQSDNLVLVNHGITLSEFTNGTCMTSGTALGNNTATAASGVATFSSVTTLAASASTIYIKATDDTDSAVNVCSGVITVASGLLALNADAGVNAASEPFTATVGQPAQIVVTATNNGPGTVTNAHLRWETFAGLAVSTVQAGQSACTLVEGSWLCDLGELSAGAEAPFTFAFTPTLAGEYELVAAIEGDRLDLNLENDRVTISVIVSPAPRLRSIFLPILQSHVDAERNRPEEDEIYLPAVRNP